MKPRKRERKSLRDGEKHRCASACALKLRRLGLRAWPRVRLFCGAGVFFRGLATVAQKGASPQLLQPRASQNSHRWRASDRAEKCPPLPAHSPTQPPYMYTCTCSWRCREYARRVWARENVFSGRKSARSVSAVALPLAGGDPSGWVYAEPLIKVQVHSG